MTAVTRLAGGSIATPEGTLDQVDVLVAEGRIIDLVAPDARVDIADGVIDVTDRIVAPGLIDMQINGGWGGDFTGNPCSISEVAARLPSTGVTAFMPTIVTSSPAQRQAAFEALADLETGPDAASALGLHFEGPIISPNRPGAHNPKYIGVPSPAEIDTWTRRRGVAIITLAPEVSGATELISRLADQGIVVSAGHTECSAVEFATARAAGVSMVTHLFNAMAPFSHREPGPIGATLADESVFVSIICDGIHIDPVAVRMAYRALGPARTILVSDAVAALGLTDGTVLLGDLNVTVSERGVRTSDDVLAGSNLALDQAIRNLVRFTGCSPAQAIRAATTNPAQVLGLTDRGRVQVGCVADLVVFDRNLELELTIIGGHTTWKS